jgi:predicted ArsR family transcriptional regulator
VAASLQEQARALGHPTRHRIFRYVAEAAGPVDVAQLTGHVGLNHNAVRQHLAKLVDAELLLERREPSGGRGRPRLVYEPNPGSHARWGLDGPYERLSRLLAEVIDTGETPVEVGRRAGRDRAFTPTSRPGTTAGVVDAMARQGFEPSVETHGNGLDIILRSCPFRSTALAHPDTVCALHLGIAQGLAEDVPGASVAELVADDPRLGSCVLRLRVDGPGAEPSPALR